MHGGLQSAEQFVEWVRIVGGTAAEGHGPWSASIRVPVLATLGTSGEAPNLHAGLEAMRGRAVHAPRFDIQVIEGADHCYAGHEQELAEVVLSWLNTLPGTASAARRHWWSWGKRAH